MNEHKATIISLVGLIEGGVNGFIFEMPEDADVLLLRTDDVSALWSMGPCRAINSDTAEYYDGCMVFVTILPDDSGRIVFRVWVIDNKAESVSYSEE